MTVWPRDKGDGTVQKLYGTRVHSRYGAPSLSISVLFSKLSEQVCGIQAIRSSFQLQRSSGLWKRDLTIHMTAFLNPSKVCLFSLSLLHCLRKYSQENLTQCGCGKAYALFWSTKKSFFCTFLLLLFIQFTHWKINFPRELISRRGSKKFIFSSLIFLLLQLKRPDWALKSSTIHYYS
jgi:hypothetical protein